MMDAFTIGVATFTITTQKPEERHGQYQMNSEFLLTVQMSWVHSSPDTITPSLSARVLAARRCSIL